MNGEALWNSVISGLSCSGEELQTTTGLWFRATSKEGRLYVDKSTNNVPSSELSACREISRKEFLFVYSYYDCWVYVETGIKYDVSKESRNTAYVFALIDRFSNLIENLEQENELAKNSWQFQDTLSIAYGSKNWMMADGYIDKMKRKYEKVKKAYKEIKESKPINENKTAKNISDITISIIESVSHKDLTYERQSSKKIIDDITKLEGRQKLDNYKEIEEKSIKLKRKIQLVLENSPSLHADDASELDKLVKKLDKIAKSCQNAITEI